jgi:hypothetical protein
MSYDFSFAKYTLLSLKMPKINIGQIYGNKFKKDAIQ